jgi:hypothetical protein
VRLARWAWPVCTALVLTLANAAKPAVVDDSAYLFFARHIAAHPLDPYGFELFWYRTPLPAMKVLAPPVVPYWLAAGVALFGENLFLLKLWLLPFALLFCFAAWSLLRRFARGTERAGLLLLALSPTLLPLFNFMLDVPALALGLAAVALFVRGCDRNCWGLVLAAGMAAGFAVQTKYTMLTLPAVFAGYGLLHRRIRYAILATLTGVAVFATWELYLGQVYGTSHFLFHVREQESSGGLNDWLREKSRLFNPLLGCVGGLATAWGLYAGRALGLKRGFLASVALVAVVGLLAVCFTPNSASVLLRSERTGSPRLDLPALVFFPLGASVLLTVLAAAAVLGFRRRRGAAGWLRRDADAWFLVGWLALEIAAYFVLTPFPASRRVMTVCVVLGLVACRLASRVRRVYPRREPGQWIIAYGVALGFGLLALDTWDALPERELARQASAIIGEPGPHTVWTEGHWGWQYYTDRAGMKLVDPGHSHLRAGDWLVLPVHPDAQGFYRPYHGEAKVRLDPSAVEPVAELVWDDLLPAQTIPDLYGGWKGPLSGRDHARLRVRVYRVLRDWVPPAA